MQLEKIKHRPQFLLFFVGSIIITIVILLMIYVYNLKTEDVLYTHIADQVSAINKIKIHALSSFLDFRKSDIQALAASETILNLSKQLKQLNKKHGLKNLKMNKSQKFKDVCECHNRYKKYLSEFLKQYMYTDALLLDTKSGNIIFSVNYEQYVGRNLNSDRFRNTEITKVYKKVLDTKKVNFSDMHIPTLYSDEPVMLLAAPVLKDNQIISVIMLKLPSTLVNTILHYKVSKIKSCETYAVGEDYLLRSDITLQKTLTVNNSFNHPKKYSVRTENIDNALLFKSGVNIIKDYRNIDVISAYSTFVFDDIKWAVVTEIDKIDFTTELKTIKKTFYTWTLVISFFVFIVGYFLSKKVIDISVINPLVTLYAKAKGFEDIINNSLNEIYIFSKDEFYFIFANDRAINNSGYSLEELQNMKPFDMNHNYNKEEFLLLIEPLLKGEKRIQIFETKYHRKDGTSYDIQINLQLIEVDGSEKFVAIVNDITEYKNTIKEKDHYYHLSTYDYLTNQFNRQMFDTLFHKEVERSFRYNYNLSLAIMDIDLFKNVNDTYGHRVGDDVLVALSSHVKALLRDSDIFARWGGEEFVILLPHINLAQAAKKVEHIRATIEKLKIETAGSITCSFGLTQLLDYDNVEKVFTNADEALYKAKENGRNRVELFK